MKIIKETVTELIIQTRTVFDFWLPSSLLIAFGLIWMALNYHGATLKCDRAKATQSACELVRWGLLGVKTRQIQLASLQGAKVEKIGYSSRVVLITDAGDVPFTDKCTNWGRKEAVAAEIEFYVKNDKQKLLDLSQDDRWLGSIGGILFLAGIGITMFAKSETYSFNISLDSLTVKKRRFLVNKVIQHSLSNISGVEVEQTKDRDNDTWYEIRLLVLSGDKLSLASTMNPYQSAKIAKVANNFLSQRTREINLSEVRDDRDLKEVLNDSQLTHPN